MHNWDDLRFFIAIAQQGSVSSAAEILKVNQSTVSRRINNLEEMLEVRLFERFSTGFALTNEGEALLQRALRVEDEMHAIDRHIMGKNIELKGPIRVTCSQVIARYFLVPLIKRFQKIHPGISIYLDVSNSLYNLTAREADVAIRVTKDSVPDTLVGRVLGEVTYAVYGQKDYLAEIEKSKPEKELDWIGEDDDNPKPVWLPNSNVSAQPIMRSNDVLITLDLVKQGMGVGRLPHFIAQQETDLLELRGEYTTIPMPIWMLSHGDMRRVNRVKAFTTFIANEFVI